MSHDLTKKELSEINKQIRFMKQMEGSSSLPLATPLLHYQLRFANYGTVRVQIETIFKHKIYHPHHVKRSYPFFIDCGANIGVSVFYLKHLFPKSRIIAFEPDHEISILLKTNIQNNKLDDITIIEAALAGRRANFLMLLDGNDCGRLAFPCELSANKDTALNCFDNYGKSVKMSCHVLSSYLTEEVDFLKMNIEGSELDVVIEAGHKFQNVRETVIEYHSYKDQEQRLDELLAFLRSSGFKYSIRYIFSGYDRLLNPFPLSTDMLNSDVSYCILIYACRKNIL